MNYELPNPAAINRILTNIANEFARFRRAIGASHERIEEVVRQVGQEVRASLAGLWDDLTRQNEEKRRLDEIRHAEVMAKLEALQSAVAYGFNQDFDRPE